MKVQGTLTLEDVKLFVRIDVPDDQREVFVTNVHPDCLVIPKERWRIEFLGLPPDTVQELKDREISTLGQLVDEKWNIGVHGLSEETHAVVLDAVRHFLGLALVFELPTRYQLENLFSKPLAVEVEEAVGQGNGSDGLTQDIGTIGLRKPQEDALRNNREVNTFADLLKLGRNRLVMTTQMDEKGMQKIEKALRKFGLELLDR